MKRALQGFFMVILLMTGLFYAYQLIYANSVSPKQGTSSEALINVNPVVEPLSENKEPAQGVTQPVPALSASPANSTDAQIKPEEVPLVEVAKLDSIQILVNKSSALPETYIPGDLVTAQVRFAPNVLPEKKKLRREAAEALTKLMDGATQDGLQLYCVSGYRSYATQKAIYEAKLKVAGLEYTSKYVAYPGQSEHQTGLAMDVTNAAGVQKPLTQDFGQTKEGKWLQANAHFYGFIIRYPAGKESITGYNYEPWHIRYVGRDTAESMQSEEQTLEEYLAISL